MTLIVNERVYIPEATLVNTKSQEIEVNAKSQKQVIYELNCDSAKHMPSNFVQVDASIQIAGVVKDKVTKNARLLANGFDDSEKKSGRIGVKDTNYPDKYDVKQEAEWEVTIPDSIASSPYFTAKVFAKPMDSLLDAIESLVRNPFGCFEQTSSVTYPMVMAL
jgi:hypothetical protein